MPEQNITAAGARSAFIEGVIACGPTILGYWSIGFASGAIGAVSGFSTGEILLLSALLYAGSAQFLFYSLWTAGAGPSAVVLAVLLVNIRYLLMSSYLARFFSGASTMQKFVSGVLLTDETFGVATQFAAGRGIDEAVKFRRGGPAQGRALHNQDDGVGERFGGEQVQVVRLNAEQRHLRPGDTVSGPSLFTLADIGGYVCVLSHAGPDALAVTVNLDINFMRKAPPGPVYGHCRILKLGRSLMVFDIDIVAGEDGQTVAFATGTYSIPPKRKD